MPLSGGPARQLTFDPASDIHPAWSPDGSRIAFVSNRNGLFNIWIVAAGGGEARPITTNPGDNLPTWSPDGRWLAFRRITQEGNRLFRLPAGGGPAEQLNRLSVNGAPRWAKDGASVFYPQQGTQIWAVSLDTLVERKSADFAGRPGSLGPFSLATDGTWLYFSWLTAEADLWTMDVGRSVLSAHVFDVRITKFQRLRHVGSVFTHVA
jgi:Tol biopolymer transport system component